MTDESRPLSRRERRAREMRDAARTEDTTPLEAGLDTAGMPMTEGTMLSRRERRRLERLQNPVETWTAEEEMLATGQIPAMTPERIAEQERAERERAEQAQREAETAAQPVVIEDEPETPVRASVMPDSDAGEPEAAQPEPEPEPEPDATTEDEIVAEPEAIADVEDEPESDVVVDEAESADESEVRAEDESEPEPEPEPEPESPAAPLGMPPGMSPEMFEALFPPGSLQRRLMEQQAEQAAAESGEDRAVDEVAPEAAEVADASAEPEPEPEPEPEQPAAADAEPRATESDEPTFAPSWASVSPAMPSAASQPEAPSSESPLRPSWHVTAAGSPAQADPEADVQPVAHDATESEPEPQPAPMTSWSANTTPASAVESDAPVAPSAADQDAPSFEAILGTGASPVAPSNTSAPLSAPSQASAPFAPVSSVLPAAVPSVWDNHPLSTSAIPQVTDQVDIDPDELESEPLPRPDLSGVRPLTSTQTGEFAPVEPVPTGQIEVERRERPDLGPAGGVRHFGWAQVAVLGAAAFVLGVVVWNVAELG